MKKGIWFAFSAVVAATMIYTVAQHIVGGSTPRVLASGGIDHENKNFNSFPINNSAREFYDWLS